MAIGRTTNPTLSDAAFRTAPAGTETAGQMTVQGTVNKSFLLLAILLIGAGLTWRTFFTGGGGLGGWVLAGALGGFAVAMVTVFKKTWAPYTAPLYAFLQGLFLGGVSAFFEAQYPGIVIQAATLTFATLFALLLAYRSGWIKVTEKFRLGVIAATGGIFVVYMANMLLTWLTPIRMPFIHDSGAMGILFSLFVVGVAALNLVLDFDLIERGAAARAPAYMEWYGSFALMVTLVWLYLEMLRLLAKLRRR